MSIEDGVIDDGVVSTFAKWMDEKGIPSMCPVCGQDDRALARHLVSPVQMQNRGIVFGEAYPLIMLICNNCAFTQHFSAVVVGLYAQYQADQGERS